MIKLFLLLLISSMADLGIGNQPTGNPDWTFAGNAGSYQVKRLRVLVRCK